MYYQFSSKIITAINVWASWHYDVCSQEDAVGCVFDIFKPLHLRFSQDAPNNTPRNDLQHVSNGHWSQR